MRRKPRLCTLLMLVLVFALFTSVEIKPNVMGGAWVSTDWNKTYGGAGNDAANSLVLTSDGGYALAGSTASYGAGYLDFWLVKADSSGNIEWNRTYGGAGYEIAYSIVQTSDGGYALGGFTSSYGAGSYDFWLVKTDSSGNIQWNKTYGGSGSDQAYSMIRTSDEGYVLAGHTQSYGAGLSDFWLVKTDQAGNKEWSMPYGGSKTDVAHSVATTSDGGYAIVGRTQSYGAGGLDFWFIRTDSLGNVTWSKTYGGANNDAARSVVQSIDGGYALAGETASLSGYNDFWLVKTNSTGDVEWNRTYGGSVNDFYPTVAQTSDGGYALAGSTNSFGAGNADFWLIKTDSLGKAQWNRTSGEAGSEVAFSLVLISDRGYALAGSTTSFGAGGSDFWLVKLTPSPIYIRADGSVDPPTAPMLRSGDVYTLADTVYTSALNGIVIERNNTVLDGAGYLLQGTGGNTGILVQGRNNVTIRNMGLKTFSLGINLSDSLGNVIQANSVTDCEIGIALLSSSSGNNVSGNSIAVIKGYGIHIDSSSSNVLTGNDISDNYGGIRLLHCTNLAYHNNFINNNVQVFTLDSLNVWDNGYPSGGNYWSDYAEVDVDGNGFGDTPYTIGIGNQDNYPLMTPYPFIEGDINRDRIINQLDIEALSNAYASTPTSPNWISNADVNNDKIINVLDLRILGKNYGKATKE